MKQAQLIIGLIVLLQSTVVFGKIDNFAEVISQANAERIEAVKNYRKFMANQDLSAEPPTPSMSRESIAVISTQEISHETGDPVQVTLYQLPESGLQ